MTRLRLKQLEPRTSVKKGRTQEPKYNLFIFSVKDKAWRRACILGTILISVQAFSGNYALISYGANILAASGTTMNPELQTLSFPAVMMTGAIISMCVVERVGRRVSHRHHPH